MSGIHQQTHEEHDGHLEAEVGHHDDCRVEFIGQYNRWQSVFQGWRKLCQRRLELQKMVVVVESFRCREWVR